MEESVSKTKVFIANNCPLSILFELQKKKKDCCKRHKKGDRCKKCPGRK